MRPTTILRGVGLKTTSLLTLLGLFSTSLAHAADPPAKPEPDAAAEKSDDKDKAATGAASASVEASSDAPKADAKAEAEAPASETPPEKAPPEAGSPIAAPPATLAAPPGDVARLPPEAFPSEPIRGIYGGSLWLTFHGLQWPTSPFHSDPPRTQLGFSGYAWADTSYQAVTTGDAAAHDKHNWVHQARFALRATPTYTKGNMFVQGQGELVAANSDDLGNTPSFVMRTDDLWVRIGSWNKWDVQVGRYQAWEIYHYGMGLDQNTAERIGAYNQQNLRPNQIYGVSFLYERPSGFGNAAFHIYPTRYLRAEMLLQAGYAGSANSLGGRPAVILDFGWLKLKGAAEMRLVKSDNDTQKQDEKYRGGGGAVQIIVDPRIEFGANGAYGNTDIIDSMGTKIPQASVDEWSAGGFLNVRAIDPVIIGVGANYSRLDDTQVNERGEHGEFSHFQSFAAVQALVLDQLFVKFVFGYARADFAPATSTAEPWHDTSVSGRLRLMYLF